MKMDQQPTEPAHLTGVHFSNKWLKLCTHIPLTELRWISVGRSTWPTCITLLPFKRISLKHQLSWVKGSRIAILVEPKIIPC